MLQSQQISRSSLDKITAHDPHATLGLHDTLNGGKVIRLFRPAAETVYLEVHGKVVSAEKKGDEGLFELPVSPKTEPLSYRVYHQNGLLAHDPYACSPTFGEVDAYLFGKGVHYELYKALGARLALWEGVQGVKFAVWAPESSGVSLVADFNFWDGRTNPMRSMGASGVWELFIPGLEVGEKYKFEIRHKDGSVHLKADPYAYASELRPATASIVCDLDRYVWGDGEWMRQRKKPLGPLNVYEVHLGSWRKKGSHFQNYRDLAHQLAAYCKEMHFTHVELLPVAEHPLDESWGYQVSGFYAATSRYGTPEDFQYFVDTMHRQGIGVLLDWVPAHFPKDDFALAQFDGSSLYEHQDPRQGYHPHWSTCIFNYGRKEVSNFLIANALFWLEKMHIDGLRVDAVASMLYLDYGRNEGEWVPNVYGGKENLEAIEFLKHLNAAVHERCPGALMVAEESTAFTGVTHPLENGGMGFDLKWNLGWMNDTLRYFHKDPLFRHYHHNELTFGLLYAFSERFALVLSHDEVVHGKGSLISKMPGDDWQRFANLRLLYSYMICQPGKKLFFMGGELAQWGEWNCRDELHWFLLRYPLHQGMQRLVRELGALYLHSPPLWEFDFDARGFEWIDFSDRSHSVVSYLRKGGGKYFACVHNFTPSFFAEYVIRLPNVVRAIEIFNSDKEEFGGSGKVNGAVRSVIGGFQIQLAPLATMIFEVEFES